MTGSQQASLVVNAEAFLGRVSRPILRDSQLSEIRNCFLGEIAKINPIHAWIYGSPGAGKTLCVRHLLENEVPSVGASPVFVNCRERFTFLSVIEGILERLKPLCPPQKTREVKLAALRSALAEKRSVVALDEVDILENKALADLLYHLSSFPRATVLCIASSRQPLLKLPESIKSRLAPRQILFPRYRPDEIMTLLRQVAEKALRPGSWTAEALEVIVNCSYGDARRALAVFRHAVQRAEAAGKARLLPVHVLPQNSDYSTPRAEEQIVLLSSHHRILYEIASSKSPIPGLEVEAEYQKVCDQKGEPALSTRTVSNYLTDLCLRGLLVRARGPGTSGWIYRLPRPEGEQPSPGWRSARSASHARNTY